jgi:hypothetical protein
LEVSLEVEVKFLVSATLTVAAATAFMAPASNPAHANTYTLTLTDSAAPAYSGAGTLVISGSPTTGEYCLSASCTPGDTLTSLSFTIDGIYTFSTSLSGASGVSATFTGGVLTALGFDQTVGTNQFHMPAGGNLEYSFEQYDGPEYYTTGLVTDPPVSATPLPAAFSLFAGGLGLLGLFGRRKKRTLGSQVRGSIGA